MTRRGLKALLIALAISTAASLAAVAHADNGAVQLRFDNNSFAPRNLTVPAGKALTIKVLNASTQTIEFESFKLNREKVIQPGETIVVHVPALSPGTYDFYDDFHQTVPQGSIDAK